MKKTKIVGIFLILIVIVGVGYFSIINKNNLSTIEEEHHEDEMVEGYEIYPGIVADKIKNNEDIILLDVRTIEEYEEVHLMGALLLPVQELSAKSLTTIGLGGDAKDKEIIIYCRSGARSKTAHDIMKSLGYTNIKSVSGGMIHWEEDNYPYTEQGAYDSSIQNKKSSGTEALADGPRIALETSFHDFGDITQYGGTVSTDFVVKNKGTETLVIGDITTSCSCTSADVLNREVKAGEETILTVVFDPDFHEEPFDVFKRTVFIPTNDSTVGEAEVTIQVDIIEGE